MSTMRVEYYPQRLECTPGALDLAGVSPQEIDAATRAIFGRFKAKMEAEIIAAMGIPTGVCDGATASTAEAVRSAPYDLLASYARQVREAWEPNVRRMELEIYWSAVKWSAPSFWSIMSDGDDGMPWLSPAGRRALKKAVRALGHCRRAQARGDRRRAGYWQRVAGAWDAKAWRRSPANRWEGPQPREKF